MASQRKRNYLDQSVYQKAIERIEYCYKSYDQVVVSFSGGKDSTAVLNVAYEVAERLGKLPLKVMFFDEEAIHPPTIEYVQRVSERPGINLEWYCLPFTHRNACSSISPYWICWNEPERDIWVRPMPDQAITHHRLWVDGMTVPEFSDIISEADRNTCVLTGIRAQESLRRQRAVSFKRNDNYINPKRNGSALAHPIYDWSSTDVWKLVEIKSLDYNRTYDFLNQTRLSNILLQQRVGVPFGEQPLQGLWKYAECWPDMWARMIERVPGVATAYRYAKTELYNGRGKPDDMSYRDYIVITLSRYPLDIRREVAKSVNACIKNHFGKTDDDIHETEPHPYSGASWKYISMVAAKGDLKQRFWQGMLSEAERSPVLKEFKADHAEGKIYPGITLKKAIKLHFGRTTA